MSHPNLFRIGRIILNLQVKACLLVKRVTEAETATDYRTTALRDAALPSTAVMIGPVYQSCGPLFFSF